MWELIIDFLHVFGWHNLLILHLQSQTYRYSLTHNPFIIQHFWTESSENAHLVIYCWDFLIGSCYELLEIAYFSSKAGVQLPRESFLCLCTRFGKGRLYILYCTVRHHERFELVPTHPSRLQITHLPIVMTCDFPGSDWDRQSSRVMALHRCDMVRCGMWSMPMRCLAWFNQQFVSTCDVLCETETWHSIYPLFMDVCLLSLSVSAQSQHLKYKVICICSRACIQEICSCAQSRSGAQDGWHESFKTLLANNMVSFTFFYEKHISTDNLRETTAEVLCLANK